MHGQIKGTNCLIASKACNMTVVASHEHSEFSSSTWNTPNHATCGHCGKPPERTVWLTSMVRHHQDHATSLPQTPAITPFSPCQWQRTLEKHNLKWCCRTAPRPCSCRAHVLDCFTFNLSNAPTTQKPQCEKDTFLGLKCLLSHVAQRGNNKTNKKHVHNTS